jgi:hypothetical protein
MLMDKSAYMQRFESVSYHPLVKAAAKERGNILCSINFQKSHHGTLSVDDLNKDYLKFDVERELVFTTIFY